MDYSKTTEYIIKPVSACKLIRNCSGCGRKEKFVSTGNFRVNANGNQIDVWLIYQCEKCKHTYNLTVYERVRPGRIPGELYQAFLANDSKMALKYGTDNGLFGRNRAEVDSKGPEYILEAFEAQESQGVLPLSNKILHEDKGAEDTQRRRIIIHNPYNLSVRIDKLLTEILGISRTQTRKFIKEEKISFTGAYLSSRTEISYKL